MDKKDKTKIVTKAVKDLLEKMGVAAEVAVTKEQTEDQEEGFDVDITGDDLGALIGYHGETLSSLQLFLNVSIGRKLGQWQRILVDIGGYREERGEKLKQVARRAADRARFLQNPVTLNPMPSFERRLVHMALSKDDAVKTESTGEGWERRVVVKPSQH